MNHRTHPSIRHFLLVGLVAAAASLPTVAKAEVVVVREAPPPREEFALYPIEIEPHFAFGPRNVYGDAGFGGGLRLSVPLVAGHLGRVPDNLAISFGGDLLHYDNCYGTQCGANYLLLPVAAQWNIFVARRVSLFGEGGAFLYKGWFDGCRVGDGPGCVGPRDFGVLPTVAVGVRVHVGRTAAFTARLGYPTTTLGFSFL
jgi:hypothetical protein